VNRTRSGQKKVRLERQRKYYYGTCVRGKKTVFFYVFI